MRGRTLRFAALTVLAVAAALAGPASACLPQPPGATPPTEEEVVRSAASWSTDIIYGQVVRGTSGSPRFRVLHVYKGSLRPGMTIAASPGWGLNPPPCAGMLTPPPVPSGQRGVIFFSGRPELNFLSDRELELMTAAGFIQPRPADRRR